MNGRLKSGKARKKERGRKAERTGRRAEWLAGLLLTVKGFTILERRFRTPAGEIDIIARRGSLMVFVEVKARARTAAALEAVTPGARRRICAAAGIYRARCRGMPDCTSRYDIVTVAGWCVRHVPGAWRDAGYGCRNVRDTDI